jgi:myo-inositol catabolism protein IolC
MCELLIPAEKVQLEKVKGDKEAYESAIRPQLTVQTLKELQEADIEPDVWMVERLNRRDDCERIVAAARHGSRDRVGCVALCREEDDKNAREWLAMAATVPGFNRFRSGALLLGIALRMASVERDAGGRG